MNSNILYQIAIYPLKLIRTLFYGLLNISLSILLFNSIKVYLSNHLTIGLYYLFTMRTNFPHPVGIVIGRKVKIGNNCTIYQNVTIGTKDTQSPVNAKYPEIGNNVTIFANSIIFGDIKIGDNSVIGAGTVIYKDIPPNSVVVGNPCKIISR